MSLARDLARGIATAAAVLAVAAAGHAAFAPSSETASVAAAGASEAHSSSSSANRDRGWSVPAQLDHSADQGPSGPRTIKAQLTGYSWQDNTPAGSAAVSHPQLHDRAGGIGSYDDPVTVAVGHSLATGTDVLDWPAGTRFYFPTLQRYGVAEDTCGDGPSPELKACHKHVKRVDTHLDVWIGGEAAIRKPVASIGGRRLSGSATGGCAATVIRKPHCGSERRPLSGSRAGAARGGDYPEALLWVRHARAVRKPC